MAALIGRYAHAKQFKRLRRAVRTLRSREGRVQREVARQLGALPARADVRDLLACTGRILAQHTKDKNKGLLMAWRGMNKKFFSNDQSIE